MLCIRSNKHSLGKSKSLYAKDIPDNVMMIPPGIDYTNFIEKEQVFCLSTSNLATYLKAEVHSLGFDVPPLNTTLILIQDSTS